MYRLWNIVAFFALPLLFMACNGQEAEETAATEQTLTDYRNYVTDFERDSLSETQLRALQQAENDSVAWETEKERLQEEYEQQRAQVEANRENMSPEQQNEADQLDQRYKNALETRENQYQDASHRYKLRQDLLGLTIEDDDLSEVTANNIEQTYTRFVSTVRDSAETYETRDWQLIEGWWSALNSRYRTVESNLSQGVKNTVQQAQNQYKEIRPIEEAQSQVPQQ